MMNWKAFGRQWLRPSRSTITALPAETVENQANLGNASWCSGRQHRNLKPYRHTTMFYLTMTYAELRRGAVLHLWHLHICVIEGTIPRK
jgi:hypothetical protein